MTSTWISAVVLFQVFVLSCHLLGHVSPVEYGDLGYYSHERPKRWPSSEDPYQVHHSRQGYNTWRGQRQTQGEGYYHRTDNSYQRGNYEYQDQHLNRPYGYNQRGSNRNQHAIQDLPISLNNLETREGRSQCAVICDPEVFCSNHFAKTGENTTTLAPPTKSNISENVSRQEGPESSPLQGRTSLFEVHHAVQVHETLTGNGSDGGVTAIAPILLQALNIDPMSDAGLNISKALAPRQPTTPFFFATKVGQTANNVSQVEIGVDDVPLAHPAGCLPDMVMIDLRDKVGTSNDPNKDIYPHCTRVPRCGGCCSHDLLECQPKETEMKNITVLQWHFSPYGDTVYDGKRAVELEFHKKCQCGCKTKPADCNILQYYIESRCTCQCKNIQEETECFHKGVMGSHAQRSHFWDPTSCSCKCKNQINCSTGYVFDNESCMCSVQSNSWNPWE